MLIERIVGVDVGALVGSGMRVDIGVQPGVITIKIITATTHRYFERLFFILQIPLAVVMCA